MKIVLDDGLVLHADTVDPLLAIPDTDLPDAIANDPTMNAAAVYVIGVVAAAVRAQDATSDTSDAT